VELAFNETRPTEHFGSVVGLKEPVQGAEKTQGTARAADKVEVAEAVRAADQVEQANGTVTTTKKEKSATTTANGIISVDGGRAATDCFTLQIRDVSVTSWRSAAVSAATTKDADQ
jgi:hypothetical protein